MVIKFVFSNSKRIRLLIACTTAMGGARYTTVISPSTNLCLTALSWTDAPQSTSNFPTKRSIFKKTPRVWAWPTLHKKVSLCNSIERRGDPCPHRYSLGFLRIHQKEGTPLLHYKIVISHHSWPFIECKFVVFLAQENHMVKTVKCAIWSWSFALLPCFKLFKNSHINIWIK